MKSYKDNYERGLMNVMLKPKPKGQKFSMGTFVMIAKDLGHHMRHFKSNRLARVEYSYKHAYGSGGDDAAKRYSLHVRYDDGTWSSIAWYDESQLTEVTDEETINKSLKEIEVCHG